MEIQVTLKITYTELYETCEDYEIPVADCYQERSWYINFRRSLAQKRLANWRIFWKLCSKCNFLAKEPAQLTKLQRQGNMPTSNARASRNRNPSPKSGRASLTIQEYTTAKPLYQHAEPSQSTSKPIHQSPNLRNHLQHSTCLFPSQSITIHKSALSEGLQTSPLPITYKPIIPFFFKKTIVWGG